MSVPYRSVFDQLLQFVPRNAFDALVRKYKHEAHSKDFPSHTKFVAMMFMQLGQADSPREIELGIGSIPDKFNHPDHSFRSLKRPSPEGCSPVRKRALANGQTPSFSSELRLLPFGQPPSE